MDMSNVADRLQARFGGGSRPDLRRKLYQNLEALCNLEDEDESRRAYEVIAGVAADAVGKKDPGHYFAFVVQRRLREKGFFVGRTTELVF